MSKLNKFMECFYNDPNYDMLPSEFTIDNDDESEASYEQIEKDLMEDELYYDQRNIH